MEANIRVITLLACALCLSIGLNARGNNGDPEKANADKPAGFRKNPESYLGKWTARNRQNLGAEAVSK